MVFLAMVSAVSRTHFNCGAVLTDADFWCIAKKTVWYDGLVEGIIDEGLVARSV